MRIIISPAKKMRRDSDSLPVRDLPVFLSDAEKIAEILKNMSVGELKKLWKCNDQILAQNVGRLRDMDLHSGLTPAILAYEGIQYRYMAPQVFTRDALEKTAWDVHSFACKEGLTAHARSATIRLED